jgi:hypothetical protein
MNARRTLIVGLIFLAFLGIYFVDRAIKLSREAAISEEERIVPLQKDDVLGFTLTNANGTFTLQKSGDKWCITSPLRTLADQDTVSVMLSNLAGGKRRNEFKPDGLDQYGLKKPAISLDLQLVPPRKPVSILIGDASTYSGQVYAKLATEDKVFTVSEHIQNILKKDLHDLRDKTVIASSPDTVVALRLYNPEGELYATKDDEGRWEVEKPVQSEGDKVEIENLLRKANNARASEFVDEAVQPLNAYQLTRPTISLTVEKQLTKGSEATTETILLIGKKKENANLYYAMRKGDRPVFLVAEDLVKALKQAPNTFRDKSLFSLSMTDIADLVITAGKSTVHLKRDLGENQWVFADDQATPVDQDAVFSLLSKTMSVKAKEIVTDNPKNLDSYGLAQPKGRFVVANTDGTTTQGIVLGQKPADRDITYVKKLNENTVMEMDWQLTGNFFKTKSELLDKTMLRFETPSVVKIEISQKDKENMTLTRERRKWDVTRGKESGEVESLTVSSFLFAISRLKYDQVVLMDAMSLRDAGLDKPHTIIRLYDSPDHALGTLAFGNSTNGKTYAMLDPEHVYKVENAALGEITNSLKEIEKTLQ